jgi:hypothetical protein
MSDETDTRAVRALVEQLRAILVPNPPKIITPLVRERLGRRMA